MQIDYKNYALTVKEYIVMEPARSMCEIRQSVLDKRGVYTIQTRWYGGSPNLAVAHLEADIL